jgi:hypothetical protein
MNDIARHIEGIAECVRKTTVPALREEARKEMVVDTEKDTSTENSPDEQKSVKKQIEVSIAKADEEQQTVTGIVLQPEVVDGQGDIMSEEVIRDSAYAFLMNFNKATKLGIQHNKFPVGKLALVESWLSPMEMAIGTKTVKQGSWIMTVKILDKKLWEKVKKGEITGFSIGGKAKVVAST